MSRLYPFTYYGSQYRSLPFILERLPETEYYVEPFGGSGIVLLNREKRPHEVLNDLNGEIVNFFQVLRDHREEFVKRLELTPYARGEFENAVERRGDDDLDAVERARLFFIRTQQGRYSRMDSERTKGEWTRSTTTVRGGNPQKVNKWMNKIEGLGPVADRLRRVQIEQRDALQVIRDYDDSGTLFYLDPPYPPETRGDENAYGTFEFSRDDHTELLDVLQGVEGRVALSGYDNGLYDSRLSGWYVSRDEEKVNQNGSTGTVSDHSTTQEVLWTNYEPREVADDVQATVEEWS
jgi:DNA adenine methylase